MGALKVLVAYLFYLVLTQERHKCCKILYMDTVAICGIIMAITGIMAFYIPILSNYFIQNNRLGSVLQYPNTYGLLMIICILCLISKDRLGHGYKIGLVLIWAGLFLTFSRSIYMMGIGAMVFYLLYDRRKINRILWPCFF